ncbi:MAG: radical SAM protein [Desulfovibrio sp.]|nr:radical SAM protein [Desulfovibrio sp.]
MSTQTITLSEKAFFLPRSKSIYPLFIPFRGCPVRCLFCAQDRVTGIPRDFSLTMSLQRMLQNLRNKKEQGHAPCELAFYGGTFTALPHSEFEACISSARQAYDEGLITGYRCSTRPDALSDERLELLRASHCTTIELGIQTFCNESLQRSLRSYRSHEASDACERVCRGRFLLGVQLLPGMPHSTPSRFLDDVRQSIALHASFLRFYPCLVFAGTGLAALYEKGDFIPWDLETTITTLAHGYVLAARASVSVIRMGLLVAKEAENTILAGPRHPALGARVLARALYYTITSHLPEHARILSLSLPYAMQGFFWGDAREMAPYWDRFGLDAKRLTFSSASSITFTFDDGRA